MEKAMRYVVIATMLCVIIVGIPLIFPPQAKPDTKISDTTEESGEFRA